MSPYRDTLPAVRPTREQAFAEYGPKAKDASGEMAELRAVLGAERFAEVMWPQVKNHTSYPTREAWSAAYEARREQARRKAAA